MEPRSLKTTLTDGVVSLRCPKEGDAEQLIAGRDSEFRRFIGEGSPNPEPTAIVLNPDNQIVGWIDYDLERAWLAGGEVNNGYNTFPNHRGRDHAVRALGPPFEWIAEDATVATATLLIDPANEPSIGVACRAGFEQCGDVEGQLLFRRDLRQR